MNCEHCQTVFCWDDADTILLGSGPKRFCSKECKRNAKNARHARNAARTQYRLLLCRERAKTGYATGEAALLAVAGRIPPLYPYECPCGWWHLTSDAGQEPVGA